MARALKSRTAHLNISVSPEEKAKIMKQAKAAGKTLVDFVLEKIFLGGIGPKEKRHVGPKRS